MRFANTLGGKIKMFWLIYSGLSLRQKLEFTRLYPNECLDIVFTSALGPHTLLCKAQPGRKQKIKLFTCELAFDFMEVRICQLDNCVCQSALNFVNSKFRVAEINYLKSHPNERTFSWHSGFEGHRFLQVLSHFRGFEPHQRRYFFF